MNRYYFEWLCLLYETGGLQVNLEFFYPCQRSSPKINKSIQVKDENLNVEEGKLLGVSRAIGQYFMF